MTKINTIGIIGGNGQMGRMFKDSFSRLGKNVLTSDIDSKDKEKELIAESDLVIVSVPIGVGVDVVRRISKWLRKDQLLSDFTSVKNKIVPEMLKTEAYIISCHPMFGGMADMSKQSLILMPVRPGKYYHSYDKLYEALDLNIVQMDWEKHDEYMSIVQGLMHFLHIVFSQTLQGKNADLDTIMQICSPVYRSNFAFSCRIMSRDPHLYTHILMDNPENTKMLKSFIEKAEQSLKLIQNKEEDKFKKSFNQAAEFLGDHGREFNLESNFLVEKMREFSLQSADNKIDEN